MSTLRTLFVIPALVYLFGCAHTQPVPSIDLIKKGEELLLIGDYYGALNNFNGHLEYHPNVESGRCRYNMGLCYIALNKIVKAAKSLEHALVEHTDKQHKNLIHYRLAICYNKLGRFEEALQELKMVPKGVVEEDEMLYQMGTTLMRTGDWAQGRSYLERLIKNFPKSMLLKQARLASTLNSFAVLVSSTVNIEEAKNITEKNNLKLVTIDSDHFVIKDGFKTHSLAKQSMEKFKQEGFKSEVIP